MNRRVTYSFILLLVTVCLCSSLVFCAGALYIGWPQAQKTAILPPAANLSTLPPATASTAVNTPSQSTIDPAATLPAAGANSPTVQPLPPDVSGNMDTIEQQVISVRGLQPQFSVPRGMLNDKELHQRVLTDFFADYTREDARDDSRVLQMFALLPPAFDLYQTYIDLYSEQVAGYYDDKAKEMFVIVNNGFKGPERMTYAHEYTHALQDQTYNLREGLNLNDDYCQTHSEACAAATALIEGDASASEEQWLTKFGTQQDLKDIQDFYASYHSPVYDALPEYMKQDFLFPYQQGAEFVRTLFDNGGWAAVDNAYRSLPQSTEQILHPQKYPNEPPQVVTLPDLQAALGEGWQELDRNTLGEWFTYLTLSSGFNSRQRLPAARAGKATAGWGGDQYAVLWNEARERGALALLTQWDDEAEASDFEKSFADYGNLRWGKAQESGEGRVAFNDNNEAVLLLRRGNRTLWLIAPDASTLLALQKPFTEFANASVQTYVERSVAGAGNQ